MEDAKLDILAMLGMAEIEAMDDMFGTDGIDMDRDGTLGTDEGAVGDDTLDLFMHFSMCPLRTSLRLNFLPHS